MQGRVHAEEVGQGGKKGSRPFLHHTLRLSKSKEKEGVTGHPLRDLYVPFRPRPAVLPKPEIKEEQQAGGGLKKKRQKYR